MASKLQYIQALSEQTASELTARRGNWMRYLDTAARLYKYSFPDQMLIHAQKPDAVAVAAIELWNDNFNRWVRRGTKGIALIDDTGHYPRLKYVFDVNDTEPSRYNARPVTLWEMRQEHKTPVLSELAKSYEDVSVDDTLADAFRNIANQLASEYYSDNERDIHYRAENSYLEPRMTSDFSDTPIEYEDDGELRTAFVKALTNSVAYMLMSRCGLDAESEFDDEDFQVVTDFNTPDMVYALGTASSDLSEQVLRDIELVIKKYERVKDAQLAQNAERSENEYDRNPYLQPSRGLSASRPDAERTAESGNRAAGTLRQNEESVPQRTQDNQLQSSAADGETVSAFEGDRPSGDGAARAADDRVDGTDELARQVGRPDGVDGGDERLESASGGNGSQRADLQLTELDFSQLGKSSIEELLSTSSITMGEVDSILRDGGNFDNHKQYDMPFNSRSALRIAARFAKEQTPEEQTAYLRHEYLRGRYGRSDDQSGKGFIFGSHRIAAWFDGDGIHLGGGDNSALSRGGDKVNITWAQAAARTNELMIAGEYVSREAFDNALDNELSELAGKLWDFYRDEMGGIPDEWNSKHGNPDGVALIKQFLYDPDERQMILDHLIEDAESVRGNLRWRHSNPDRLIVQSGTG
jgi:hypothetical protein